MTQPATMKRMREAEVAGGGAGFLVRMSKRPGVPNDLRSTLRDWVAERAQGIGRMAEVEPAH